jgi:peptidoglycan/xylan/chitin deacetylase (PgdA/CDA1 family)
MDIEDILEQINSGRLSRRAMLRLGAAAGISIAGLTAAGCISFNRPAAAPSPAPTPRHNASPWQLPTDPEDLLNTNPLLKPLTDFQDTTEFGGDAVYDKNFQTYNGQWPVSLMLSTTGAGNANATTKRANLLSPDMYLNQYQMWLSFDHPENVSALRLFFIGPGEEDYYYVYFDVSNMLYLGQITANQWCRVRTLMDTPNIKGSPDSANPNEMIIQITTTGPCTVHMNDLRVVTPQDWLAGGAVMIVCDGGYISQFTGIKASLDRYGYSAVVAVSSKYYGSSDYMSVDQLKTLYEQGWDIGVHGSNPISTGEMTEDALDQLWNNELDWISAQGIRPVRFLAAPEGVWTQTIETVARRYFLLTRCSMQAYNSALPQYPMYVQEPTYGSTSLDTVKSWIDVAKANHFLLCILMHGIYPAGNTGGWYDQASFDGMVDYINAQGLPVITPTQLWDNLGMSLPLNIPKTGGQ